MSSDSDLARFVEAQDPVYGDVRAELQAGRKTTHWMWVVFPQLRGLGRSATARFFGIDSAAEAAAYLQHPVLGARLRECVELVLGPLADVALRKQSLAVVRTPYQMIPSVIYSVTRPP